MGSEKWKKIGPLLSWVKHSKKCFNCKKRNAEYLWSSSDLRRSNFETHSLLDHRIHSTPSSAATKRVCLFDEPWAFLTCLTASSPFSLFLNGLIPSSSRDLLRNLRLPKRSQDPSPITRRSHITTIDVFLIRLQLCLWIHHSKERIMQSIDEHMYSYRLQNTGISGAYPRPEIWEEFLDIQPCVCVSRERRHWELYSCCEETCNDI